MMTLKRWMLGKVNEPPRRAADAGVAPTLHGNPVDVEPRMEERGATTTHLGRYAPLVEAIRVELEHFVTRELRLHLAIAERDRYVLSSIEVECEGSATYRDLLQRFMREFKPEQIKQYLARDIIAGLRNASAIDLSQFAGLNAQAARHDEDDAYASLLADLETGGPAQPERPYAVTLVGRWSEQADEAVSHVAPQNAGAAKPRTADAPPTPLAGRTFLLAIDDAGGAREIELDAVVPGRRYTIGKDAACDIPVDGTYASRRHCRVWFEKGTWWVEDAQSTNGIRVEANGGVRRHGPDAGDHASALEWPSGAALVLSAHGDADPSSYPRLAFRSTSEPALDVPAHARPSLATPIAPARRVAVCWSVAASMASGTREADIDERLLPFRIGRSRNQALVIDWTHSDVSGRHVEIVAADDHGVSVVVHGENGVSVAGTRHESGARFRWAAGEPMRLGRIDAASPACTLTLSRVGPPAT